MEVLFQAAFQIRLGELVNVKIHIGFRAVIIGDLVAPQLFHSHVAVFVRAGNAHSVAGRPQLKLERLWQFLFRLPNLRRFPVLSSGLRRVRLFGNFRRLRLRLDGFRIRRVVRRSGVAARLTGAKREKRESRQQA